MRAAGASTAHWTHVLGTRAEWLEATHLGELNRRWPSHLLPTIHQHLVTQRQIGDLDRPIVIGVQPDVAADLMETVNRSTADPDPRPASGPTDRDPGWSEMTAPFDVVDADAAAWIWQRDGRTILLLRLDLPSDPEQTEVALVEHLANGTWRHLWANTYRAAYDEHDDDYDPLERWTPLDPDRPFEDTDFHALLLDLPAFLAARNVPF